MNWLHKMSEELNINQESQESQEPQEKLEQELQDQVDYLAENEKLKKQLLLLAADFENFRKRSAKEKEDEVKYGMSKFARDMIDVLENLHRAEESIKSEDLDANPLLKQIFTGVELTKKSLIDAFEKYGIKRISPIGEQFDHNFHQAITQMPSTTHKSDEIVQVIQAGYIMHDRLLRPALVVVAKSE